MGFLSKVNKVSRNILGTVGRPVATVAAVGTGAHALGSHVEALSNPWAAAGVGVGAAIATEGTLYFFGDTTELDIAEAVTRIQEAPDNLDTAELSKLGLSTAEIEFLYGAPQASDKKEEAKNATKATG